MHAHTHYMHCNLLDPEPGQPEAQTYTYMHSHRHLATASAHTHTHALAHTHHTHATSWSSKLSDTRSASGPPSASSSSAYSRSTAPASRTLPTVGAALWATPCVRALTGAAPCCPSPVPPPSAQAPAVLLLPASGCCSGLVVLWTSEGAGTTEVKGVPTCWGCGAETWKARKAQGREHRHAVYSTWQKAHLIPTLDVPILLPGSPVSFPALLHNAVPLNKVQQSSTTEHNTLSRASHARLGIQDTRSTHLPNRTSTH